MSASQRRVPRKKIDRPVGLLYAGDYLVSRVLQVGEGGLMIATSLKLQMEDRLLVTFSLRGDTFITSKATIRYRADKTHPVPGKADLIQYGLEFDELPFQARRDIRAFVASHSEIKATSIFKI